MSHRSHFTRWLSSVGHRPRDAAARDAAETGGIDVRHLATLVATPRPTILEIGAHDGGHTLRFLRAFAAPEIHCFEPEPRALSRLRRAVAAHPSVHVYDVAVGSATGRATFHRSSGPHPGPDGRPLPQGWDYSGSLLRPLNHLHRYPQVTFDDELEVDVVSIDEWIAGRGIDVVDLVWIDAQGAEGEIIRGMRRTLPRVRFIYTEFSDDELYEHQPTLDDLLAHAPGFHVAERFPEDVLLARA